MALASCTTEAIAPTDGGVVYLDRERDDAGNITRAIVHVAGMQGAGLTLTFDGTQELTVPSDGVWHVPLATPAAALDVQIVTQPSDPVQRCDVLKLDDAVFSVLCGEQLWEVSGVVSNLVGNGLRVALYADGADDNDLVDEGEYNVITLSEAGDFAFTRPLHDHVPYRVEIVEQPTAPRQECKVTNEDGTASADITNIQIDCVTKTYIFTTTVVGLKGSGLTIDTEAGPVPLAPGLTVFEDRHPDGYVYHGEILQQPTNPSQTCFLQNAKGVINGDDVRVMVICDAQGSIQITEVGACPHSDSACWFEVVNMGNEPENLAFYKVRTSALSPKAFVASRIFTLPDVLIPPARHVVIQGKVAGSMPDGNGVYHIADNDTVPWWSSDGFVEVLNPSGATASFLRWGSNTIAPTTGGTYSGGAAPALPRGAMGFGYSLQHPNAPGAFPHRGEEFQLWQFPTYGGPNDVVSDSDTDSDGIPDTAEIVGGSYSGLNLYEMGARIGQRDIFVEIDHMGGADPATLPRKDALDRVVEAFRPKGISVHFDVGNLFAATFDPANYNLGGGNEVQFATSVGLAPTDARIASLYDIKAQNMAGNRRMVFYYQLFAYSQQADGSGGSSGVGELPGNDSIVTLGGFGLGTSTAAQRNLISAYQAASVMHELGHNFGLRHGGGDSLNRKPNYISVMNYLYSPLGLPTIGSAEGDRFDYYTRCSLSSVTQLTNAPSGDLRNFVIDFSNGSGASLDENSLREGSGLGRLGSGAVDFNCNKRTDALSYSRDLNNDGSLDMLTDNDDWAALDFVFRRYATGADKGPSLRPELERFDVLTADTHHHTDAPCPAPAIPSLDELY